MCVGAHMCMCACVCVLVNMGVCVGACGCMCIGAHGMCVCVHVCICVHVCVCVCMCVHVYSTYPSTGLEHSLLASHSFDPGGWRASTYIFLIQFHLRLVSGQRMQRETHPSEVMGEAAEGS